MPIPHKATHTHTQQIKNKKMNKIANPSWASSIPARPIIGIGHFAFSQFFFFSLLARCPLYAYGTNICTRELRGLRSSKRPKYSIAGRIQNKNKKTLCFTNSFRLKCRWTGKRCGATETVAPQPKILYIFLPSKAHTKKNGNRYFLLFENVSIFFFSLFFCYDFALTAHFV